MAPVPESEFEDELRRQRFELRLVQEEAAVEGERLARRQMSWAEAIRTAVGVGSSVAVTTRAGSFTGVLVDVSDDLLTLRHEDPVLTHVVLRAVAALCCTTTAATSTTRAGLKSLSQVLSDAETLGYSVTLRLAGGEPLSGRVGVAGREHVELDLDRRGVAVVNVSAIVAVVRPESPGDAWAEV